MTPATPGSDWIPRLSRVLSICLTAACGSTVDTVGYERTRDVPVTPLAPAKPTSTAPPMPTSAPTLTVPVKPASPVSPTLPEIPKRTLRPLRGPASYPNPFRDVLGKTEAEIKEKVDGAFDQLFHGDPDSEAIYYEDGEGAYIKDILHGDVRTEGMGLGMMIAVQLDKREEFDRLWRWAKSEMQVHTGVNEGYFRSRCNVPGTIEECLDPYGLQQFVMSLVFAHGRWQSEGEIDYEGEAFGLFDVMRKKEEWNGGIQGGATNTFDADTKLVFDVPNERAATYTRPALVMPAYYSLWAQATGDSFYTQAADSARAFWKLVADPDTGLVPGRAEFDGDPVQGWETFTTESYRTHFNVMLDGIWSRSAWSTEQANRVIAFFTEQGINEYVREYTLDGMPVVTERESSLTPANGALALVADIADREAFIDAVWNQPLNRFQVRYYSGTLLLLALISLSGQFRVY